MLPEVAILKFVNGRIRLWVLAQGCQNRAESPLILEGLVVRGPSLPGGRAYEPTWLVAPMESCWPLHIGLMKIQKGSRSAQH